MIKVLNLYSGLGGNRRLWTAVNVIAVEINPKIADIYENLFPQDKVIVADAHQYLLKHYKEFDFIWSSPPCITHTRINKNFNRPGYVDLKLYEEIIFLKSWFKGKWCVENVIPYYKPLIPFQQINRHAYWCNFVIEQKIIRNPVKQMDIRSQHKNKRGKYNGDIYNMQKFIKPSWLREIKVNKQYIRNCVDSYDALSIFNSAFKEIQLTIKQLGLDK